MWFCGILCDVSSCYVILSKNKENEERKDEREMEEICSTNSCIFNNYE